MKGGDSMSENTNSLFWIIVGAVVIVGIFTLVQANIGGAITGIFEHFNGLFQS